MTSAKSTFRRDQVVGLETSAHHALLSKQPVPLFDLGWRFLTKGGGLHALLVEECSITRQSTSLGTTGYVYDIAGHMLCGWSVRAKEDGHHQR